MRKHITSSDGAPVDLDDPKTYEYLPNTTKELRDLMYRKIGYAIVYMDYLPSRKGLFPKSKSKNEFVKLSEFYPNSENGESLIEINNGSYNQRQRVYQLIKDFAENENGRSYTEDEQKKQENLMWYKEQVFLFEDEIENMC